MTRRFRIFAYQMEKILKTRFSKIIEINKKYSHPRLVVNKSTAFALLMLRIYLLFLVGLLIFKFILTARGK
ncbi:MAG: hypothetical protein ABR969_01490 [Sedimentisphaerales bacterium]